MSNLKTEAQLVVNLLLRGILPSDQDSGEVEVAGYKVTILGPARAEQWEDETVAEGDLHGVVWATPRDLMAVIQKLLACEEVVDARSAGASTDEHFG